MGKVIAVACWAWIPFCGQPLWGQSPSVGMQPNHKVKQQPQSSAGNSKTDQRGTKEFPIFIDPKGHKNTPEETAAEKADKEHASYIERWTLVFTGAAAFFTGLLIVVGQRGVNAANRTLSAIEDQTKATRESIEVLINSERAWLSAQVVVKSPLTFEE